MAQSCMLAMSPCACSAERNVAAGANSATEENGQAGEFQAAQHTHSNSAADCWRERRTDNRRLEQARASMPVVDCQQRLQAERV